MSGPNPYGPPTAADLQHEARMAWDRGLPS